MSEMKTGRPVLNLTQHACSPEQATAGVVDVHDSVQEYLRELLTFETLPSREEIEERAGRLADLAWKEVRDDGDEENVWGRAVMIGGAPFLMGPLEAALKEAGLQPVYAFSRRESEEQTQQDGSVRKVAVFRHLGFVE